MQELINKYFDKLCSEKFFKNDDEIIIGKAKDVINNLKEQITYVKNPKNKLCEIDIEIVVESATELIEEINQTYSNKDDVIEIAIHPMAGFYVLKDKKSLLKELKEYYEDMEENKHGK